MAEFAVVKFSAGEMQSRIDEFPSKPVESNEKTSAAFGIFYIVCFIISISTFILDVVVHCWIAYLYHFHEQHTYFTLTVIFVFLPTLVTNAFSLRWYIIDVDEAINRPPIWKWIIRLIFLLFQVAPLLRYFDSFIYGMKSRKSRNISTPHANDNYRKMLDEDLNAASLRLFHCFLFAAPQAIIQLTAFLSATTQKVPLSSLQDFQIFGLCCSLVSIAWSIASYHRSMRSAHNDKENLTWFGTCVLFLWYLTLSASRVLALSLLASLHPVWMIIVCFSHWLVMSVWVALSSTQMAICGSLCEELVWSTMLGFVFVILYISPRDGPTRYTYLAYYLVCFMENTGSLVVWCVGVNSADNPTLYYGTVIIQVCTFLSGIFFMVLYYCWFHPVTSASRLNADDVQKPKRGKCINVLGE